MTRHHEILPFNRALVAWTPGTAFVRVGPLIQESDRLDWCAHPIRYQCTGGAAWGHVREAAGDTALALMLVQFFRIVVIGRCDLAAAHDAFMGIQEYRDLWVPFVGADDGAHFEEAVARRFSAGPPGWMLERAQAAD